MLAEGGTGWNHGISMARSRAIAGPYELDPQPSVLTTRDDPDWPLQKAGHGEIVQTPPGNGISPTCAAARSNGHGRPEIARQSVRPRTPGTLHAGARRLQRVVWSDDGWLRLADGGVTARSGRRRACRPAAAPVARRAGPRRFRRPALSARTGQSLRVPAERAGRRSARAPRLAAAARARVACIRCSSRAWSRGG